MFYTYLLINYLKAFKYLMITLALLIQFSILFLWSYLSADNRR